MAVISTNFRNPLGGMVFALMLITACGTPEQMAAPSATTSAAAAPAVRSVIDPQWLSLGGSDWNWRLVSQDIGHDRWVFNLQPLDETFTFPNDDCTGCNHSSSTAVLTVYTPGAYDPAAVRTGEKVTVSDGAGHYLPPRWPVGSVLAWEYAENAWATAQGRSETAAELPRLRELAAQLRPDERTPIRFPLSLSTLPVDMPLSKAATGFRTYLSFAGCGDGRYEVPIAACTGPSDRLTVQVDRLDEFSSHRSSGGHRQEVYTVPVRIGGRDGLIHEHVPTEAAIKAAPGVIVVFRYSGTADRFHEILGNVVWAPDIADESSWLAVTDWT